MDEATTQALKPLACDVLQSLDAASTAAQSWLRQKRPLGPDALAIGANDNKVLGSLAQVDRENFASYRRIADEPFVSRVTVELEDGQRKTFLFCTAKQGLQQPSVVSYFAPVGRLASLPVGEEFELPRDGWVTVVERLGIQPRLGAEGWDGESILQLEDEALLTIASLRGLIALQPPAEDADEFLRQIFAETVGQDLVQAGLRRRAIETMGFREQPILDKFQDEIFRLPLSQRLVLLGPPGTGKTTTLIRRLAQKLAIKYLDEDEQRQVREIAAAEQIEHERSWLMFTPSELLKQYLKEAFSREEVPAPDSNVSTWDTYRHELCRDVFPILKTAAGRGTFVMRPQSAVLDIAATKDLIGWFEDFDTWQRQHFLDGLRRSADVLANSADPASRRLGIDLQSALSRDWRRAGTFMVLLGQATNVQRLNTTLKEDLDKQLKAALSTQVQKSKDFLAAFGKFLDNLSQPEVEELDDQDVEEEEVATPPRTELQRVADVYMRSVRSLAKLAYEKRQPPKGGRMASIAAWLDGRIPTQEQLVEIGEKVERRAAAAKFVSPVRRYFDGFAARYRSFRRERQGAGKWYQPDVDVKQNIHPLELDTVLLAVLKNGQDLLENTNVSRDLDKPFWAPLRALADCQRNQILIDEATDFSPIQLACMSNLAHPRIRSVFACGDFNQRLTTWGLRTGEELNWCLPGVEIREINVAYRQSKQLNELARSIVEAIGGTVQSVHLPAQVDSDVVPPALVEHLGGVLPIAWLAARIVEIEQFVGKLPSIAVFVNSEEEVESVANSLADALLEQNVRVEGCRDGRAVGQESSVRVFNIKHIKGLEFEAVFFVGIDRLAAVEPELFDRYIYVGVTRAAAYLGLTCDGQLPERLEPLRNQFVGNWESHFQPK